MVGCAAKLVCPIPLREGAANVSRGLLV
uniref:Uncharacterized protein n=1 Tax=Arundo donax TaxID=35708 RepID=A0A0A9BI08_ARUDO